MTLDVQARRAAEALRHAVKPMDVPSGDGGPGQPARFHAYLGRRQRNQRVGAGLLATGLTIVLVLSLTSAFHSRPHPATTNATGSPGTAVGPVPSSSTELISGVVRIDPQTDQVVKRIKTRGEQEPPGGLRSIAVTSEAVWLGPSGSRVDPGANQVVGTAVPGVGVPLAGDRRTVWSWRFGPTVGGSPGWNRVIGVDAITGRVSHRIEVPPDGTLLGNIAGIALGAGSIWVVGQENGESIAWRASTRTDKVVPIPLPGYPPTAVAFGDGRFWFLDTVGGTVRSIDPATNAVSAPISLPGNPTNLAVGAGAVWVVDYGAAQIYKVLPGAAIEGVVVGTDPIAIAVGAGAVWVVNRGDGTVTKVDPIGGTVLDTIHVAPGKTCPPGTGGRCGGIFDIAIGAGGVWVVESGG